MTVSVLQSVYDSQCMTPVISDDSDYKAHSATHTTLGTMSDLSPCYLIKILNLKTFVHLPPYFEMYILHLHWTHIFIRFVLLLKMFEHGAWSHLPRHFSEERSPLLMKHDGDHGATLFVCPSYPSHQVSGLTNIPN